MSSSSGGSSTNNSAASSRPWEFNSFLTDGSGRGDNGADGTVQTGGGGHFRFKYGKLKREKIIVREREIIIFIIIMIIIIEFTKIIKIH